MHRNRRPRCGPARTGRLHAAVADQRIQRTWNRGNDPGDYYSAVGKGDFLTPLHASQYLRCLLVELAYRHFTHAVECTTKTFYKQR